MNDAFLILIIDKFRFDLSLCIRFLLYAKMTYYKFRSQIIQFYKLKMKSGEWKSKAVINHINRNSSKKSSVKVSYYKLQRII